MLFFVGAYPLDKKDPTRLSCVHFKNPILDRYHSKVTFYTPLFTPHPCVRSVTFAAIREPMSALSDPWSIQMANSCCANVNPIAVRPHSVVPEARVRNTHAREPTNMQHALFRINCVRLVQLAYREQSCIQIGGGTAATKKQKQKTAKTKQKRNGEGGILCSPK